MSSRLGLSFKRNSGSIQTASLIAIMAVSALAGSHDAFAGTATTGGTATADSFESVWTAIVDFSKGSGGKLLTGLFVVVGVAAGIMKGSLGFCCRYWCRYRFVQHGYHYQRPVRRNLDQVPTSIDAIKQIANGLMQ